ncbi:hypothetical protein [Nitratireductor basaltis]|uniref:Uncharacterized protein n=1 Tax=Nitratireductor basaltis TaxID=472175 RepID=A0A084UCU3_9HYPH|nr:hypothetical protein [Nitratireductor basaltis]KFB10779.1 hypothetical protein EL18_01819 [Nitratireductor basaltis]
MFTFGKALTIGIASLSCIVLTAYVIKTDGKLQSAKDQVLVSDDSYDDLEREWFTYGSEPDVSEAGCEVRKFDASEHLADYPFKNAWDRSSGELLLRNLYHKKRWSGIADAGECTCDLYNPDVDSVVAEALDLLDNNDSRDWTGIYRKISREELELQRKHKKQCRDSGVI